MSGSGTGVNRETCRGGRLVPTVGTSGQDREAVRAAAGVGDLHSSVDPRDSITRGERREGTCSSASKRSEGQGDGSEETSWLRTPGKVRELQLALYRKAKEDGNWRFYSLYGEVCRLDVLSAAVAQVIANDGAPGVDGYRVRRLRDAAERERFLHALRGELTARTYRPSPVRRVYIWKDAARTKRRALGIPTVRDRVVQTACALVLMPIWEADFHTHSYGYRPRRRTTQAMDAIKGALLSGRTEVVDADVSSYFDTIPHRRLLRLVARRVSDGSILSLVKAWLRAPVSEVDGGTGRSRVVPNRQGTPQGGVISPLLANVYLNALDHAVNDGCELHPVMVRYADDLVILCRSGEGPGLRDRLGRWLAFRGLTLNDEKTRLVDTRRESVCFLGFRVGWRRSRRGRLYPHVEPGPKSCGKLRASLRELLHVRTRNQPTARVVAAVNAATRGWGQAFHYANSTRVFSRMQNYTRARLRTWLWRKHNRSRGRYTYYTDACLHARYGLWRWPLYAAWTGTGPPKPIR